jgi:hypothetical protein
MIPDCDVRAAAVLNYGDEVGAVHPITVVPVAAIHRRRRQRKAGRRIERHWFLL